MESNTKIQFKIGIFLTSGLFLILGSIFMLGADRAFFKSYVTLHAHFDQVQGLAEGSVVSFAGITIGNVRKIQIVQGQNLIDAVLDVDKDYIARITKGSKVEIRTQGALGDKFIYIIPGPLDGSPLQDNATIEVAKATDFIGIISERGTEAEKIFDIINEMHKFTKTLNAENRTGKILINLESTTAKIDKAAGATMRLAEELNSGKLKSSMEHLNSVAAKLDSGQGTLGALINDSSLHDQLKSLLGATPRKSAMKTLLRTSIEKSEGAAP
ncbi:MAG: MCE family protein [Bdellovibrionaceae bacterium]|nr:MCE family protein [Pseudobdellovibrionaceae bacterium]